MGRRTAGLVAAALSVIVAAVLYTVAFPASAARAEEGGSLPGMCSGRTDADLVIIAHANGKPGSIPKFILNVATDSAGQASGSMVVYRGADHLTASDFCRVWQHLAGQPSGDCGEVYPVGAITAHVVGLGRLNDQQVLVRADVRKLADGQMLFRLRYRAWPPGEMSVAAEDSCDEGGWTWLLGEEQWAPLDHLKIMQVSAVAS